MPRPEDLATRELERNVVQAVYSGVYKLKEIQTVYPRVSRRIVGQLVSELPEGLEDTDSSLALTRACNMVCGLKEKQRYTVEEQRQAVYEFKSDNFNKTKRDIENEYGINASALKRLGNQLETAARREPTDSKLKETADSMHIKVPGRQCYLTNTENAIWHAKTKQRGDMAEGLSRHGMTMDARQLVRAIGEGTVEAGGDPRVCERLLKAKCGKTWLANGRKRAAPLVPEAGFVSASSISHKRAAAAAPEKNEAMFDNIEAMYKELFDAGILLTPEPIPEQVDVKMNNLNTTDVVIAVNNIPKYEYKSTIHLSIFHTCYC